VGTGFHDGCKLQITGYNSLSKTNEVSFLVR
jgi:hypothetical protein